MKTHEAPPAIESVCYSKSGSTLNHCNKNAQTPFRQLPGNQALPSPSPIILKYPVMRIEDDLFDITFKAVPGAHHVIVCLTSRAT